MFGQLCRVQRPGEVTRDPQLAGEVRELIDAIAELTRRWEATTPAAFIAVRQAVIATFEDYLEDPRMIDPREVRAIEYASIAARDFHIENRGWDPHADVRGRAIDALRRIREQIFSAQFATSSAAYEAALDLAGGAAGATLPNVPGETARERRKRIIGYNIRRFRQARGLSQNALAKLLGIGQPHVARWENAVWEPSPEHLEALAAAFDVEAHDFYREEVAA